MFTVSYTNIWLDFFLILPRILKVQLRAGLSVCSCVYDDTTYFKKHKSLNKLRTKNTKKSLMIH